MIFKDLRRNATGVTNCPTCKDRPCQVSPPPIPTDTLVPEAEASGGIVCFCPPLERGGLPGLGDQLV